MKPTNTTLLLSALLAVLALSATSCSKQRPCGNGRIDPGEQCDWRLPGNVTGCTQYCTLMNQFPPGGIGTGQYCYNGIPGQFCQYGQPNCLPCQGGIGQQMCYPTGQPGCIPNGVTQCVPCQGGIGGQLCFRNLQNPTLPPTQPGCNPQIHGPQACVPCSGGFGSMDWCIQGRYSLGRCIQGAPGCQPCTLA
jgi:cysteine-rich repeat protein